MGSSSAPTSGLWCRTMRAWGLSGTRVSPVGLQLPVAGPSRKYRMLTGSEQGPREQGAHCPLTSHPASSPGLSVPPADLLPHVPDFCWLGESQHFQRRLPSS